MSRFCSNLTAATRNTCDAGTEKLKHNAHQGLFPKARVEGKLYKCSKLGYVILIAIAMRLKVGSMLSFLYSLSPCASFPSFLLSFFLNRICYVAQTDFKLPTSALELRVPG